MIPSNFYETIFKRKSVRKYGLKSLEIGILTEVKAFLREVKPLYDNIKTEIKIVSLGEVNGLLSVKAPHYLIMTSENKNGYQTNAGYMFQQVDLLLSSKGIGTCYLGLTQPNKDIKNGLENEVVMVLAFGNSEEKLHRTDISEFKRKQISEITNIINYDELLEAARLAPSATNSQPWYFTGGNGVIHAYCFKTNFLKALVYEKLNKFDMGIALYHLEASIEHFGGKAEFIKDKTAEENPPKGYYYIGTMVLNKF